MIMVRPQDAVHKAQLLRLLTSIIDDPLLSQNLFFKGGTCASMVGFLNRFSVDLDFDCKKDVSESKLRARFHSVFKKCGLTIYDESKKALEFFVKYPSLPNQRNTIKVDALSVINQSNSYEVFYLPEIDRSVLCQSRDTMFANKLVALTDRFVKHGVIAGRDMYDIHSFFLQGFAYKSEVIRERTGKSAYEYLQELHAFIETHITKTIIDQDLNTLLPYEVFRHIRKTLKQETLMFIADELSRLNSPPTS